MVLVALVETIFVVVMSFIAMTCNVWSCSDRLPAVPFQSVDRASLTCEWVKESKPARWDWSKQMSEWEPGKSKVASNSHVFRSRWTRSIYKDCSQSNVVILQGKIQMLILLPTLKTLGRVSTSFLHLDFWDHLNIKLAWVHFFHGNCQPIVAHCCYWKNTRYPNVQC